MIETTVEWSFVPWRDRPALAGRAVVAAAASVLVVAAVAEALLLRVALGIVVALSFASFCLPRRCRLGPDGASVTTLAGTAARPWDAVRRAVLHPGGLELSPFAAPHWLEPFRGLQLPFPGRARGGAAVAERVRAVLDAHGL